MTQTAFVVGVGPGMGTAIAKRFGTEGFRIAGFARSEKSRERTRTALAEAGVASEMFAADAGDPESLGGAFAAATAALGDPSVLVYNVSILKAGRPSRIPDETLLSDFRANVLGALVATKAVLPTMRAKQSGTVLFTGGGLALEPFVEFASLSIGKAGLRSLALSFAKELAPDGIHVGTVTIAGMIKAGTHFDPDAIAEHFWELHAQPRGAWETERVFR
jgi:NAD(P)-dependent dehydrogenase (short-subunit alcohol dehydrogenase family)